MKLRATLCREMLPATWNLRLTVGGTNSPVGSVTVTTSSTAMTRPFR